MKLLSAKKLLFGAICLFCTHCGKTVESNHKKLAQNYYRMSMTALDTDSVSEDIYRSALADINQAIAYDEQPHYLAHKATLLLLLNCEQESLEYFRRALDFQPTSPNVRTEILNNYGCALARCGKKDEAKNLFEALEKDKNYLTPEVALVNQAKIYCDDARYSLAQEKLRKALVLAPDYVDAQFYLAAMYYKNKEYAFARAAVEKTLELVPAHRGAIELRSLLLRVS